MERKPRKEGNERDGERVKERPVQETGDGWRHGYATGIQQDK